jgi:hypothetical protein
MRDINSIVTMLLIAALLAVQLFWRGLPRGPKRRNREPAMRYRLLSGGGFSAQSSAIIASASPVAAEAAVLSNMHQASRPAAASARTMRA